MFTDRKRHTLSATESAELKQALKIDPVTEELRLAAVIHVNEADESYDEAERGEAWRKGSWVDEKGVGNAKQGS